MILTNITNDQINYILDFMEIQKGIPKKCAESILEYKKKNLRSQLNDLLIYPETIDIIKDAIKKTYFESIVNPGECVGIIAGQSIGEKNTQIALNTFHKAGQSEKTMTEGVPRLEELLNATKKLKSINHTIYMNQSLKSIQEVRTLVSSSLCGIKIKDILLDSYVCNKDIDDKWLTSYKCLYDIRFDPSSTFLCLELNRRKLFEYKIMVTDVVSKINDVFEDVCCIFSPFNDGGIYIYVNDIQIIEILNKYNIRSIDEDNSTEICMEECLKPVIQDLYICGIPGIDEKFFVKEQNEWVIETTARCDENTFKNVMKLPYVDTVKTITNNIWEIYETLGIEATRNFLIEELDSIMGDINKCHVMLLADRMTFNGTISSISRYTLKSDEGGPLGKASFEESLENFLSAGAFGDEEPTTGISASIMCGKRSNTGTGMVSLKLDYSKYC